MNSLVVETLYLGLVSIALIYDLLTKKMTNWLVAFFYHSLKNDLKGNKDKCMRLYMETSVIGIVLAVATLYYFHMGMTAKTAQDALSGHYAIKLAILGSMVWAILSVKSAILKLYESDADA